MSKPKELKPFPSFQTDEEAGRFVDEADLSEFGFSRFKPVQFEFQAKAAQLNTRVPKLLFDAVKLRAKAQGVPYTRYIRQLMERDVSR